MVIPEQSATPYVSGLTSTRVLRWCLEGRHVYLMFPVAAHIGHKGVSALLQDFPVGLR